jgi:CheY-like chemotaxis protein
MSTKPLALIIEDNEDQNLVFTTALTQAGFSTESIYDGVTAKDRLTKVVPSMIILDLHMPGINGSLILKEIRSDSRTAKANVIIVSADAEFASNLQAQVDLVLLKPVGFLQLSLLASRFINKSETSGTFPA